MSMRIFEALAGAGLACLALAGCDGGDGTAADQQSTSSSVSSTGGVADCAIGTTADWSRSCPVERSGDLVTLRHPDGGFRRFHVVKDGRGLVAADGAEQATVTVLGKDQIELSVGEDRYRLPATMAAVVQP
ncbi:hypothetical protein [Sphingobium sp. ZW T5_29]|uniref:hypothetical protein n=1 Tax=Sphingobium sp. ZW T5_29 TaxID=3378077 RepID=UPI0038545136